MSRDPLTSKPSKYRASKRSFAEAFFPQQPQELWKKARKGARKQLKKVRHVGPATGLNTAYVRWLAKDSMLQNAHQQALRYSGKAAMWQKPFAKPRPRAAIKLASVWYTAYPASIITRKNETILEALADEDLWRTFQKIGIQGLHTGPMKLAGGLKGWEHTPSIDGHFDRISNKIDELFGTEEQFRHLAEIAAPHGGIIIDDIVPGHTGKGADFRLAEMAYGTYPGIYHMVEIHPKDWHMLPGVPKGKDSVNLSAETEEHLKKAGYIIGRMYRVIFYEPGVKDTNWSVTKPVTGVDGTKRRWVYLHYFKEGQPSVNWLDPSFAGVQLVVGDALHSIGDLGARGLRLDANGYLGVERSADDSPAWSEAHPLSQAANHLIASMVRKVGGFTFQEFPLSLDDLKKMSVDGADLSYDFVNRPAYHHALVQGNTEFLRLMLNTARRLDIDPASLVHALDNHDELTYELMHFVTHKDDSFTYDGQTITGGELRTRVREELTHALTGDRAPYNQAFTENGVACSTVTVVTAALGYRRIEKLDTDDIERIRTAHLLLAMFNALQPGVFALSGWDLCGTLTLSPRTIKGLLATGDTRWIARGAYDMMGKNPGARSSQSGMPRATALYESLPAQLDDPQSFVSRLQRLLEIRDRYQIATARQLDIPEVADPALLVMVHRLPSEHIQVTVLNFSHKTITAPVHSTHLPTDGQVIDMFTDGSIATLGKDQSFPITLKPHQGTSLLIKVTGDTPAARP
jgi:trehalose synthase